MQKKSLIVFLDPIILLIDHHLESFYLFSKQSYLSSLNNELSDIKSSITNSMLITKTGADSDNHVVRSCTWMNDLNE